MSDANMRLAVFAAVVVAALNFLTSDLPDRMWRWIRR